MLFRIREILEKKRGLIFNWIITSALLVTFSPLANATIAVQATTSDQTASVSHSTVYTNENISNNSTHDTSSLENASYVLTVSITQSISHCTNMQQGNNCDNVVCCPAIVQHFDAEQVHPVTDKHNLLTLNKRYHIRLPADIKPPIV